MSFDKREVMTAQFARAPHQGRPEGPVHSAPNAALLIDFDNVTMGIRSDLSKELKKLLNSAVIKGKVAVQRAYADWRRYPQYIVPLSEASVDLIFAPAYGTTKKNATDIRLAIDALELVFIRPEIGTYILLSGDSDFSSLVLKLKEYGKYVIGVGMRESSSDLLVQNCDEYYSYSSLAGLTRATDEVPLEAVAEDPFALVERAVQRMTERRDVMRSDRLKQVLLELNPAFDERELGYKKFTKFLTDAGNRGALGLRKLENGQFEIAPGEEKPAAEETPAPRASRPDGRGSRGESRRRGAPAQAEAKAPAEDVPTTPPAAQPVTPEANGPEANGPEANGAPLHAGFDLLRRAVTELSTENGEAPRDSDVKRRMLELQPDWDEADLGFPKFSRFLRQAHDDEIIDLRKANNGSYEVVLAGEPDSAPPPRSRGGSDRRGAGRRGQFTSARAKRAEAEPERAQTKPAEAEDGAVSAPAETSEAKPATEPSVPSAEAVSPEPAPAAEREQAAARPAAVGLRFRRGTRGRGSPAAPPPVLAGQAAADITPGEKQKGTRPKETEDAQPAQRAPEPKQAQAAAPAKKAGLPGDAPSIVTYMTNRYKGVGKKTAESLIEAFGAEHVFEVLENDPQRVREVLGEGRRTTTLLDAWSADRERRVGAAQEPGQTPTDKAPPTSPTAEGSANTASKTSKPTAKRGRKTGRGKSSSSARSKPTPKAGEGS